MRENQYQAKLIRRLKEEYPGAVILKNDPNYIQGFPDLLILYEDRWGALETKREKGASKRPLQDYYVERLGQMSYASFICPENQEVVFHELQQALIPGGPARLPERK